MRKSIGAFHKLGMLWLALLAWSSLSSAQSWDAPALPVPFNVGVALQLTDGTILIQDFDNSAWWQLFPDDVGNYANGVFIPTSAFPAAMNYVPLYFSSAVLPDGRVIVEGGEYNKGVLDWTNKGAILDPHTNIWTEVKPPTGWSQIGDAQNVVTDNGTFTMANINSGGYAMLNASTLKWTVYPGTGKADINDEEGWTLLPGGDVLTVDAYVFLNDPSGKNSEILNPKTHTWSSAGSTVEQLWDSRAGCGGKNPSNEVGPAVLRPDGTVFATGANTCGVAGHTAIYNTKAKTWSKGPNFPGKNDIADGPAAVLPDGNVLVDTNPGYGNNPSTLYEFNGTKFVSIPQPAGLNPSNTEGARMLITANGSVLLTHLGTPDMWFYHPKGTYKAAWQPHITSHPATVNVGSTYTLQGTQFNGLTQGAYFGDDAQSATNYPLVRIRNNKTGHISFARTHSFSTMAVSTGTATVSTKFDVLTGTETGASTLEVIANGIPSPTVKITVK
jgi:hypothetical protein